MSMENCGQREKQLCLGPGQGELWVEQKQALSLPGKKELGLFNKTRMLGQGKGDGYEGLWGGRWVDSSCRDF